MTAGDAPPEPPLARTADADQRLRQILADAARGQPPEADGAVDFIGPGTSRADAVVAFFGHHVVSAPVDPADAEPLLPHGDLTAPHGPAFLSWCSAQLAAPAGSLDVVFVATGTGTDPQLDLRELDAGTDHPRVERAQAWRTDCQTFATPDGAGILVLGRGLAQRLEMAFEVDEHAQGRGVGRSLASAARNLTPSGQIVFAQVSPGNVASMRCMLAAGYQPIGSEVLFLRS